MPNWIVDVFVVMSTGLLVVNLVLILFIWKLIRKEKKGGERRSWSWYKNI